MNDRKDIFVELKNKLDDGGFDGTDLYNNFKIIVQTNTGHFFTLPLNCFMQFNVTLLLV